MEVETLNLFDLFARISLDTSEYDSGVKDVTKSSSSLASKLKSGLASAGKVAAAGIGAITTAAGAAVGGLLALEASTEEYRRAMGRLNTAFEAAGYGADTAQEAYKAFYGILGDTDTATEASQLLAKLADSEEDVAKWTNIAAGVSGTFGDSLPIESLIEAANETARTGQVVGTLADALNWAGEVGEDEMNAMLESCSSEAERNQLIMETLAGTYDDAADAFYRNNAALIASREAQARMDEALSKLGTSASEVKSRVTADFLPAVSQITEGLAGMLAGAEGADQEFSDAIGSLIETAVSKLPEFFEFGAQILSSIITGIVQNLPSLISSFPGVVSSIGSAFKGSAPQMMAAGQELVSMLANGITAGAPILLQSLPGLVSESLNFLANNLPSFVDKGSEFVAGLVDGITESIPDFVASLPDLITSFFNFIATNLPQIVETGFEISRSLGDGIIKAIPEIVKNLPAIILAIVQGLISLAGSLVEAGAQLIGYLIDSAKRSAEAFLDVGKNIVQGIWNGISGMAEWIKSKVTGFFSGIVDSVKGLLGIHSPSTVFSDMGKNMALGLGDGWDSSFSSVKRDIENGLDFGTATVDFASSGLGRSQSGLSSALQNVAATVGQNFTITVQSVLDGKVIGETAYQYNKNKQRAYG